MTISRKQLLLAAGLILSASSAFASAPLQTGFYVGGNSGASFVTNQASGDVRLTLNDDGDRDTVRSIYRNESSIRGYNGGAFVGWNFYCDESWFHGVELSGDFFSNRGAFAISSLYETYYQPGEGPTDIDLHTSNFKDVYDMEFALNLAFKPGAKINESTVLFGIIGASWARFDSNIERTRIEDRRRGPANIVVPVAHQDGDDHHHHHDNDNEQDLWGFVLGAGVSTQITHYLSAFGSYQYTYYGNTDLDGYNNRHHHEGEGNSNRPEVRITDRHSTVDTNIFKVGIAFNF